MVVSLLVFVGALTLGGAPSDLPSDSKARLKAALATGDDHQAIAAIEPIVREFPTWDLPRLELGQLLLRSGDRLGEAELQLEAARSLAPENPRTDYLWGLYLIERGEAELATRSLQIALLKRSDYDEARLKLAGLEVTQGRTQDAINDYKLLVQHQPDQSGTRLMLANALDRAGRRPEAEQQLKVLLNGPSRAIAVRRLADLYRQDGKTKEADALLKASEPPKRVLRPLKPSRK